MMVSSIGTLSVRRVDGAIGVDMEARLFTPGRLRLQDATQRRGRILSQVSSRRDASVVGDHDMPAILVQDMDRDLFEKVTVLAVDVRRRTLPDNCLSGQDEDVLHRLDGNMNPRPLAGAKSPDQECLA